MVALSVSRMWSGSLDTSFIVPEAAVKEAVRIFLSCDCSVDASSLFVVQRGFHWCTLSFVRQHIHLGTVNVFLAWSSPLSR